MYMFDLNQWYNWQIVPPIVVPIQIQKMYIPVSHANRRPIKNTIGVVMSCLVHGDGPLIYIFITMVHPETGFS